MRDIETIVTKRLRNHDVVTKRIMINQFDTLEEAINTLGRDTSIEAINFWWALRQRSAAHKTL